MEAGLIARRWKAGFQPDSARLGAIVVQTTYQF
jgi:hypothetical protein